MIAVGTCWGPEGDDALLNLAQNVMKLANEQGMVPQGGVQAGVYLNSDDQIRWIVLQAMVLPKEGE